MKEIRSTKERLRILEVVILKRGQVSVNKTASQLPPVFIQRWPADWRDFLALRCPTDVQAYHK